MQLKKFVEIVACMLTEKSFTASSISRKYKYDYKTVTKIIRILSKNKLIKKENGGWVVR